MRLFLSVDDECEFLDRVDEFLGEGERGLDSSFLVEDPVFDFSFLDDARLLESLFLEEDLVFDFSFIDTLLLDLWLLSFFLLGIPRPRWRTAFELLFNLLTSLGSADLVRRPGMMKCTRRTGARV